MNKISLEQVDFIVDSLKKINGIGELLSCMDDNETMSTHNLKHLGYMIFDKTDKILQEIRK